MLMIRLARIGKKKQPYYRLVVSEKARDMYGKALEILGNYNPRTKEAKLDADRIKHWLSKGAQASATVNNLLITKGIIEGKKQKSSTLSNKRKKKLDKKKGEKNDKKTEGKPVKIEEKPADIEAMADKTEYKVEEPVKEKKQKKL